MEDAFTQRRGRLESGAFTQTEGKHACERWGASTAPFRSARWERSQTVTAPQRDGCRKTPALKPLDSTPPELEGIQTPIALKHGADQNHPERYNSGSGLNTVEI